MMEQKILGKDLQVSAIGLGCMGMSHAYGEPADCKEMLKEIVLDKQEDIQLQAVIQAIKERKKRNSQSIL